MSQAEYLWETAVLSTIMLAMTADPECQAHWTECVCKCVWMWAGLIAAVGKISRMPHRGRQQCAPRTIHPSLRPLPGQHAQAPSGPSTEDHSSDSPGSCQTSFTPGLHTWALYVYNPHILDWTATRFSQSIKTLMKRLTLVEWLWATFYSIYLLF